MKIKVLISIALILAINCICLPGRVAYAQSQEAIQANEIPYDNSPINKLGRGVANTATCWAEIPAQVAKISEEKDPFLGATLGVAEGVASTIVRGATGIFDALTFMIPPYNKPLMQPEYALKSADDNITSYLW